MAFRRNIELVRPGEQVRAGTPNRPLRQLQANDNHLRELIEAAELGAAIFARGVALDPALGVGMAAYYNAANDRFEPALAAAETDAETGQLVGAASAHVLGVVYAKSAAEEGDLLLHGWAALDVSGVLDTGETLAAVPYYLSRQEAGHLSATRPAVGVPVLFADGDGQVFVSIRHRDYPADHVHLVFHLVAESAATDADEGWLDAADAVFDGNAPVGAVYGYNLSQHQELDDAWPPIPVEHAYLELDDGNGYTGVSDDQIVLDRYGIWWMDGAEDPFAAETIRLWFVRPHFLTEGTVVTSLRSNDDRLVIECDGKPGEEALRGALMIGLDLSLMVDADDDAAGHLVFKEFDSDAGVFSRGPVTEGIYATSDNLTLTSDNTRLLDPEDPQSETVYQGLVGIAVDTEGDRELPVQIVRLNGAEDELTEDVMYIRLPQGAETDYRARIMVPSTAASENLELRIKLRVIGFASGNLPQLTVTGRRVPDPDGSPTALPTNDSAVTIDTTATLSASHEYIEFESDPITVAPGDDFLFTIRREDADGYAADLGILRHSGILTVTGA